MKKYNEYKDSGVEWIGGIPKHWNKVKIKHLGKIKSGDTLESKFIKKENGEYPVYGGNGVMGYFTEYNFDKPILIIGRVGEKCGNVHYSDLEVYVNDNSLVFESYEKNMVLWYIYHSLIRRDLNQLRNKNAQPLITGTIVKNEPIPFPPLNEQQKIVAYLDHKTQKIDELLEIKEKKIALLKEKRTALINHVVTKGLDPDVEMKDSGVEWIGEIPKEWGMKGVRYLFDLGKGLTITKANLEDKGVFCVNYGEIHSKYGFEIDMEKHELKCVNEEYLESNPKSIINTGDFVFADTSEDIEGSGNFTYLKSESPIFAGYHTVIMKPKGTLNSRFFAYCFDSDSFRNQIRTKVKGVKVYSITQTILKQPYLCFPSIEEQNKIVRHLDKQTQEIDTSIQKEQQKIDLLKEYRQALISEVVTGKRRVCEADHSMQHETH